MIREEGRVVVVVVKIWILKFTIQRFATEQSSGGLRLKLNMFAVAIRGWQMLIYGDFK